MRRRLAKVEPPGSAPAGSRRLVSDLIHPTQLTDDQSDRKRVRDGSAQDGAYERLVVVNDCQVDGVQATRRRIENLAAAERNKSVAEGHRRCQI